jgi:hypothetical protein
MVVGVGGGEHTYVCREHNVNLCLPRGCSVVFSTALYCLCLWWRQHKQPCRWQQGGGCTWEGGACLFSCLLGTTPAPSCWRQRYLPGCCNIFSGTILTAASIARCCCCVCREPWRQQHLHRLMSLVRTRLGVPVVSPVIPLVVGSEAAALGLSRTLLQAGFHVPAIRPPTVPAGEVSNGRKGMGRESRGEGGGHVVNEG